MKISEVSVELTVSVFMDFTVETARVVWRKLENFDRHEAILFVYIKLWKEVCVPSLPALSLVIFAQQNCP